MKKDHLSKNESVGYGAPPKHSQFKIGNREYLKRRKKTKPDIAGDITNFLTEIISYREGGRVKTGRRIDVQLLKIKTAALNGDLAAAETLIDMREDPGKFRNLSKMMVIFEERDAHFL